ncbi:MAG: outer membrane beta-barrel protein [Bacteroidaceae bacterium]|nr:outer membrane beta-barrel protein [Bacteroidaceae bacterium]
MHSSRLTLALLLVALPASLMAQDDLEYRMEVGGALGAGFGINDTNYEFFGQPGAGGGALWRWVFSPRSALKVQAGYVMSKGDTDKMEDFQPAQPLTPSEERLRYSFSGGLVSLDVLYEIHFLPYGYKANYLGHKRLVPYLQIGVGATYGTAGKAFSPEIPVGFGLKYKLAERLNLGFDWQMRFTTSDKLDGLEAPQGIKSQAFKNKDYYHTAFITLTYSFAPRCKTCNKDEW